MEDIYKKIPPENIPWNIETPPDILVDLIESKKVIPCKTIDLGCGTGNYSIYMAQKGFNVTGVDISPTAILSAKEKVRDSNVNCNFQVTNLLGKPKQMIESFDFAFEWQVLHHIIPEDRQKYIENVSSILNPEAKYLSVCFSDKNINFGGSGNFRETPLGTTLYFSSEKEIEELFQSFFDIIELKTIDIRGKNTTHSAIYCFMVLK